ncbi:MAG: 50S ribosomal protein L18 [Treponema sp.]|jgi:large subunit ribosomal protein L18|nr:50S ribosomal protein L18 [Treponema sp.]MBO6132477.1 50S ribosomal protein L18 [Treponema sp.]MBP5696061.1 50S ribosomal protein L18 [Treponema sp.]MBQ1591203.1 50S ribosomal protein L18 [Treponema sp.]MBQ1644414.1 50S ribosomal protein L18 [Treponema sp.]
MFKKLSDKQRRRLHRKIHIRKTIYGTAERPRMTVYKSGRNLYVQAINDDEGKTLASISTLEKDFIALKANIDSAAKLGEAFGSRLKDKNISKVVFDRNGYLYHGVVKALADATRKAGIEF